MPHSEAFFREDSLPGLLKNQMAEELPVVQAAPEPVAQPQEVPKPLEEPMPEPVQKPIEEPIVEPEPVE